MDKRLIKYYLLFLAVGITIGYLLSPTKSKTYTTETTKVVEIKSPTITIKDTIKLKSRTFRDSIYIPYQDSANLNKIMKERDSINLALIKFNVSEHIKLDTVVSPTLDTVKIDYETLKKYLDMEIRYAPRKIEVKSQTMTAPKNDFKTLALTGSGGVVLGLILGIIIRN